MGPRGLGNEVRQRIREDGISLTLVTDGCNMGQCVDVNPARQVESRILWLASVSRRGPREGTTGGGLLKPSCGGFSFPGFSTRMQGECREKESEPGSQARKGNLLEGHERGTGR